jgi:hypothetical protein
MRRHPEHTVTTRGQQSKPTMARTGAIKNKKVAQRSKVEPDLATNIKPVFDRTVKKGKPKAQGKPGTLPLLAYKLTLLPYK